MSFPAVALGDVAKFIRGVTYKPTDLMDNFSEGSIVCMRTANVQKTLDESELLSIPRSHVKSEDKILREGDLLVSTANSWNLVGKCCWVPSLSYAATVGGFIAALRGDKSKVDLRYLYHWFNSPDTQVDARNCGRQTTNISNMDIGRCLALGIPLPPLPEQGRIAAILDKADALRAKRREAIAKLDQLLQSVFLEMFGDPVTNPKGWPQVRFSELLESIDSGTSPVCLDRSAGDNEWAVLKLSAVTRCEYDPSANKALPEGVEPDKSLEVKVGDLLFTRKNTRDLVAACAFVTDTPPRLLLPDLIFRFRLKPLAPVVPRYLQALLAFPGKRKDIQSLAGGSAGSMPNISKAKLSNALIELPPKDLQCEFERRLKHCDLLKEKQRFALAKLDATFFALQQQAFAGQL